MSEKLWEVPAKKQQDELRARLLKYLNEFPQSRNSLAIRAGIAALTLGNFMVHEKNIDWISYKKVLKLVEQLEKESQHVLQ